jgi:hypothetical protein
MNALQRIALIGLVCTLPAATFLPWVASGNLSGTDTVDIVSFSAQERASICYTVTATGSGTNRLRVKAQQRLLGLIWVTVHDFYMDPGQTKVKSFPVSDLESGSTEQLRFRFSRDILTSAIDWRVTW